MRMIKLKTRFNDFPYTWINIDLITAIDEHAEGRKSVVHFIGGSEHYILESPEEILAKIEAKEEC